VGMPNSQSPVVPQPTGRTVLKFSTRAVVASERAGPGVTVTFTICVAFGRKPLAAVTVNVLFPRLREFGMPEIVFVDASNVSHVGPFVRLIVGGGEPVAPTTYE